MDVCIETYGCSNNTAESRIMEQILREKGFRITGFEKADIAIINTCSVKSVTENRIIHRIREVQREKKLVIAGCMPESEYEILREIAPTAALLSTHHIDKVADAVSAAMRDEYVEILGKSRLDKAAMKKQALNKAVDIVPIASGCRSFCTFCSTKLAKGDLLSFPAESIVKAVENSVNKGAKEFWLTSQDNGCYGFDIGTDLAELLAKIGSSVKGDYRLRIGMMNPEHVKKFLPQLLNAYRSEKVFKFLHLPVQSGSDNMLKKMGRRYTAGEFISIIKAFRKEFPDMTIWTDMICGFPGEEEEDFEASMKMIKSMGFDFVNVSAYGNRPGTAAAKMRQVRTEKIKERTRKMSLLARKIARKKNEKWIGWSGPVLIDEYNEKKGTWIGRNFAYKPVVVKGEHAIGDVIAVKIHSVSKNSLFA